MEARKVLLNQVTINAHDRFVTVDEFRFQMWGAADGEASLRFWGVAHRERTYKSDMNNRKVIFRAEKRMITLGRGINYKSNPDAAGCIVRTYIFYPVVLAFYENKEGVLELAAFTPRWLTSGLAISTVVRKFEKAMDGVIERMDPEDKSLSEKIHDFFEKKKKKRQENKDKRRKQKISKRIDDNIDKEVERAIDNMKNKADGVETNDSQVDKDIAEVLNADWND
ncbi:MAG: hypothetical protein J5517_04885 [Eubacterium sp.]|nr:hypothetical protein [Eubacterium sp.]